MQTTAIENVKLQKRQRRHFEPAKLDQLAGSILARGLLHPIVIRLDGPDHILVAGERRLRAIESIAVDDKHFNCNGVSIAPGQIPYILITDLDDVEYREAELEENIIREDLTWQEEMQAIEELHLLRKERNPARTNRDTARELVNDETKPIRGAEDRVSRALIVAPHLDDPDVAKARDDRDAFNIVSRKLEREFRETIAAISPKQHSHVLLHGDTMQELQRMAHGQFSLVIADPPYGIGADQFGDAAQLEHDYTDDPATAFAIAETIIAATPTYTADAHLYLFCDVDFFTALRQLCKDYDWKPRNAPLIWEKGSAGHLDSGGPYGWRRCYEMVLFASRGSRQLNSLSDDVLRAHTFAADEKQHAAQKPVSLYKRFMQLSAQPGQKVLDPCCGSGTVFVAAHELKMEATGVEKSAEYHAIAQGRLNGLE